MKTPTFNTLAEYVRHVRGSRTPEELAAVAGLHPRSVRKIEAGERVAIDSTTIEGLRLAGADVATLVRLAAKKSA